jgi:hypothetical protein
MSDPMKHAWSDVADGFARLGGTVRQRYHGEETGAGDAREERKPPPEPVAAIDALREALDGLVAAGRDVGQRALDVLRDPDVNAEAKQAAASLNDALSATVDMIGREVASLFTGRRGQGETQKPPEEAEAALEAGEAADGSADVEGPNSA